MEYNYKIVRSLRKTISICVSADNEIVVRCPESVSERRIREFVDNKKDWINKVLARNSVKLDSNREIIDFKEIFVCGSKLPLVITDKNEITADAVYIKNLKSIKKLFIKTYAGEFIEFAKSFARAYGFTVNEFFVKAYKRRWGCCDSKGNITFNYLLFMLPSVLQNYVIIHELCHTVYFNHSASFWKLVSEYEPRYKILRNQLKSYDFITELY